MGRQKVAPARLAGDAAQRLHVYEGQLTSLTGQRATEATKESPTASAVEGKEVLEVPPPIPLPVPDDWIPVASFTLSLNGLVRVNDVKGPVCLRLGTKMKTTRLASSVVLFLTSDEGTFAGPAHASMTDLPDKVLLALFVLDSTRKGGLEVLTAVGAGLRVGVRVSPELLIPGASWQVPLQRPTTRLSVACQALACWWTTHRATSCDRVEIECNHSVRLTPVGGGATDADARMKAQLVPMLRPYQVAGVAWMVEREQARVDLETALHPLWRPVSCLDGTVLYVCPFSGDMTLALVPAPPDVSGGILADEVRPRFRCALLPCSSVLLLSADGSW